VCDFKLYSGYENVWLVQCVTFQISAPTDHQLIFLLSILSRSFVALLEPMTALAYLLRFLCRFLHSAVLTGCSSWTPSLTQLQWMLF